MATKRIGREFSLGGEQAESDPLLESAFYESGTYKAIESRNIEKCFIVGRTGSGKSAVLQRLELNSEHVIRINPENLSLPYILDLQVVRVLSGLGVHLDPLFIALWKHVLLIEIVRHRYKVDSLSDKNALLESLRARFTRDSSKRAALDYLEEFGESFWETTDVRVREITSNFEKRIGMTGGLAATAGVASGSLSGTFQNSSNVQERTEEAERYQRIVNETQLPRLNKMLDVLDEDILDDQNYVYVVIDDLDRDWVDDYLANALIRCLFRAVLDLQRVRFLKIIVALRTNIFEYLDFGSRMGGQEEKVRSLAVSMRWSDTELRELVDRRVQAAAEMWQTTGIMSLSSILPTNRSKLGLPWSFIVRRTLRRPRDVIAFLNEALALAAGKNRLRWEDLQAAEQPYSDKRLLALRDEWKPTFPGIDRVLHLFRAAPLELTFETLADRLNEAALLPADRDFQGVLWMTPASEPLWSGLGTAAWEDVYQPLTRILYDIGFLGIRERGAKTHYSYNSPGYADLPSHLRGDITFRVHGAFRPALAIAAT